MQVKLPNPQPARIFLLKYTKTSCGVDFMLSSEIQYVNETGDISKWIAYWLDILLESARYTMQVIKASFLNVTVLIITRGF